MQSSRGISSQQRALPFFVMTLAFTWLLQLPALLAMYGVLEGGAERFLLPGMLGGFGPLCVALLLSSRAANGPGIRELLRPLSIWRVGVHWYVIAFGIFTAIAVLGTAGYRLFNPGAEVRWLHLPESPAHIVAMLLMPIVEEPGWRGFALPRLQARYRPLKASLILGVVWAAWHAVMWPLQGVTPEVFAIGFVNVVAGSVLFSWIYNRTNGSLLLALVAHAGVHWNNPFRALPGEVLPIVTYTTAMVVTAALIVLIDKKAWRAQPQASE